MRQARRNPQLPLDYLADHYVRVLIIDDPWKVFYLQDHLKAGLALIEEIGGETDPPRPWFCQILKEGTEHQFSPSTNQEWLAQTRPILEAFWHTKYFIQ